MQQSRQVLALFLFSFLTAVSGGNSFNLHYTTRVLQTPVSIVSRLQTLPAKELLQSELLVDTLKMRGGDQQATFVAKVAPPGLTGQLLAAWGVTGVLLLLGNAIRRLLPIALQPFYTGDFTTSQWVLYSAWGLFMSYAEGYKGFHQKFSPLVVKRAFTLDENKSFPNIILAWAYSMGLFSATKKRMIISWSISAGVMALVMLVKNLPYPWRSIVDGGVVAGLSIGSLSIVYHYIIALFGIYPDIDACMPPMDNDMAAASKRSD